MLNPNIFRTSEKFIGKEYLFLRRNVVEERLPIPSVAPVISTVRLYCFAITHIKAGACESPEGKS